MFVVTGASRGLGRSVALEAARQGFSVAVLGRDADALKSVEQEVQSLLAADRKVSSHQGDLRDAARVNSIFAEITDRHGPISCLVNNVGHWMGQTSAWEPLAKSFQDALDHNFFPALHCVEEVLRAYRAGNWPALSIVNIGATASKRGGAKFGPFAVAKNSLRILSESLARELGPQGIHVAHLVIDGLIDNERTRGLNPNTPDSSFISPDAIAREILRVALQDRSCWTFEWDVRPSAERW